MKGKHKGQHSLGSESAPNRVGGFSAGNGSARGRTGGAGGSGTATPTTSSGKVSNRTGAGAPGGTAGKNGPHQMCSSLPKNSKGGRSNFKAHSF